MPAPVTQLLAEANWTVTAIGFLADTPLEARGPLPAQVPGCIHTDLIAAGLIGDPVVGLNELDSQWVGQTDWEYRCRFEADGSLFDRDRLDLVCDGLDTIARLELNGEVIGAAANMFHPHRFDVRAALRRGSNQLVIRFTSPIRHIREEEARLGARPVNGDWDPYIFIRKAACNFGWDWAPKVATCGIWKAIRLEGWSGVRIARVTPLTRRDGTDGATKIRLELEWSAQASGRPELVASLVPIKGNQEPLWADWDVLAGQRHLLLSISGKQPSLWWPRGEGEQTLYELNVELDGVEWHRKVGFSETRLKRTIDARGSAFTLEVNGRPIFCKGANWIPEGLFPAQMTREKYRERLEQAAAANMNMLRVWGGGFYESDDFYELCDELGILVWQDFMFACAMYPEEDPYPALIEAEARHQITRLSSHPSVAVWCGGNECVWAHDSWGAAPGEKLWKERLGGKSRGAGYYFDLLPRLVKELDPARPYWANSPWSGARDVPPNDADHGDRHTWDVRGEGYRSIVPRFCSEFGQQSPPNYATLMRAVGADGLQLGARELEHRQRGTGGTPRHIDDAIAELFRPPRDFGEWHYLAQLTQARALRAGIEWMRVNQPRCMGALIWQLNDAWPGMSWSLIDSEGRAKPAWHAVRSAFEELLLTIQTVDGRPTLFALNGGGSSAALPIIVQRVSLSGKVLASEERVATVAAQCAARVAALPELIGEPSDPHGEMIRVESRLPFVAWFYEPDRTLAYPEPRFEMESVPQGIRLTALSVVRDVAAIGDYSTEMFTLMPGDSCVFKSQGGNNPGTLQVRCANHFGASRITP